MKYNRLLALVICILCGHLASAAEFSDLWGESGERWSPRSRLPDFSHAGYHNGEQAPPNIAPGVSVKTFGATGDGVTDDTQAFLDALAAVKSGAVEVPPGRYKITKILEIARPGVVLRGAGPDKSVLFFPVPLSDIKPDWGATTDGKRTSNYSWSGGFVWFRGSLRERPLTAVTAAADRGDDVLTVVSVAELQPGQRVEIYQSDTPDNSLADHLYSGDGGGLDQLKGTARVTLVCRVTKITGQQVHFDRPLRWDVQLRWKPQIRGFDPTVTEAGVENLCFEFPDTPYPGHFAELGYNAVAMNGVADCWARNLRIVNADSGLFLNGYFCTAQGIVFESARRPDGSGATGHHGVSFYGSDNLFTGFDIRTQFLHDITVDGGGAGNVSSNGKGVDLCFDHHRHACSENLFVNLDIGAGTHLWRHGGGRDLGKACAARGTFWNIRAKQPQTYPPASYGPPSMNFVAVQTVDPSVKEAAGKWFEAIAPADVVPQDIHQAQLVRRLARK
ncbi:MAG: hypothetical protein K8S99_05450 [Planctomycetes bacterium]|nr:hypothetical protein [Planctomycetota bacterium]